MTRIETEISTILKDNITFSGQTDNYVIHGAVDKIAKLIQDKCTQAYNAGGANLNLFGPQFEIDKQQWIKQNLTGE